MNKFNGKIKSLIYFNLYWVYFFAFLIALLYIIPTSAFISINISTIDEIEEWIIIWNYVILALSIVIFLFILWNYYRMSKLMNMFDMEKLGIIFTTCLIVLQISYSIVFILERKENKEVISDQFKNYNTTILSMSILYILVSILGLVYNV